jgi:Tfp pilus assembly protein PilV
MHDTWVRERGGRVRHGVTLTEVVVGSALLAVTVVPMLRALTIAQSTATSIEHKTQCLILAQAKLEEIRARSTQHYDSSFRETSEVLADSYLCTVTDDEDPTLRLVGVSVGHDADGDGHLSDTEVDVRLSSYVARRL